MISPTHITFSQAFFYTGCILTGHVPTQLEALLAAVFSIFPADLDTRQSVLGRLLPFLADYVEHKWGHRGFTHALIPPTDCHNSIVHVRILWNRARYFLWLALA